MNNQVIDYIRGNRDRYLSELEEYISIPSISTLPENKKDILNAANWLKSQLESIGMENTEIRPTEGHPIVRSNWLNGGKGTRTILVYGHYDVQPVDPLNEWNSPPFTPTIKGEYLYARGAADMKGQGQGLLKALEAWKKCTGKLPVNVKILFEGEEELGSPNIESFISKNSQELKSDFCLNCDGTIAKPDVPSISYGLRGVMYYEVLVQGPKSDLHSGVFGGVVQNPAIVLSELIAGLHDDKDGRVTLSGFYDKVRTLSEDEKRDINKTGYSDEEWKKAAGVSALYGEKGFTPSEREGARPTLEINGMISGFTGPGQKTIIPASAMAKISMRTVPYQDTSQIDAAFRQYFKERAPSTVSCEIKRLSNGPYALMERNSPELRAASKALQESYAAPTVFKLEGGSVPIVATLKTRLGLDSVMMGCGLPDAGIHGPNEHLHLPTYYKGIEAYARFFGELAGA